MYVYDMVLDLSMQWNICFVFFEFPLRSPMNKLSKTHRALWVFQLNIHGGSAPDPLSGGALQQATLVDEILNPFFY